MTDELKAKLCDILEQAIMYEPGVNIDYDVIDQIEQAFREAGYWKLSGIFGTKVAIFESDNRKQRITLRSAEDWLELFTKELKRSGLYANDAGSVDWDAGDVMRAAKKAAGLK